MMLLNFKNLTFVMDKKEAVRYFLLRHEMRGEIIEYYFYKTLFIYLNLISKQNSTLLLTTDGLTNCGTSQTKVSSTVFAIQGITSTTTSSTRT